MEFRLLGPLEVLDDTGVPLALRAGRPRSLLALLLLRPNELVAAERLVHELWGEDPPATASKMVHNGVSSLRRSLGDARVETSGSAYRLRVGAGERDVDRFEALVDEGRTCLRGDPAGAAAALREALALWRGDPLADLAYEAFAQPEIARLEEQRLTAFEMRIDAELALGRHREAVPALEAAVARHPLRERLSSQLMLALYRSGRQADALDVYRRARHGLVEELGLEPGPELRALQAAVLAQDPALEVRPAVALPPELEGGSPVLVGRERELRTLRARLADAQSGRGAVVAIGGPAGIGKTRLAAELARDAAAQSVPVAYAGPEAADPSLRRGLLVLDDTDAADPGHLTATLAGAARGVLVLALHAGDEPPEPVAARAVERIVLAPLDESGVEAIARLHLPAAADVPAPELAIASGGIPGAVHRAASAWASARVAERLAAEAGRTAAGRARLRDAEAGLAADLVTLQEVRERGRAVHRAGEAAPPCPYRGLAAFEAEDAERFAGREQLIADLIARLAGASLLAVVGASGSGKSSVLRAGLLPALRAGALPGSEDWRIALLRPGSHPRAALAAALDASGDLDRLLPGERLVLAVDQAEEAFAACDDDAERAAFLDALVALAEDEAGRAMIVLCVRADFYGRLAEHTALARLAAANQVLVGPMRRDELRRAIERPALAAGLRVEPALTEALVAEAADEPGGLPLLSTALVELYEARDGRVLRLDALERTGGVRGAVARLAESTYRRLSPPETQAARHLLLRLADAGDAHAFVRRRVPLAELDTDRDPQAAAALAAFTERRLVTVGDGTAEVAHEALLREWPRLRSWLDEDAAGRRVHQHLAGAAREWELSGRDPGELYRGARLAGAGEWAAEHPERLNALERSFLEASRGAAERDARRQRAANRRLRVALGALAVLLAVAVAAGVVALGQREDARQAATVADAQRLGAQALTDDRLDHALLLARAGVALDDSVETRGNLLSTLLRSPAAIGVTRFSVTRPQANAISPDGRFVAISDNAGTVRVIDLTSRRDVAPPLTLPPGGGGDELDFSPDGRRLAMARASGDRVLVDVVAVPSLRRLTRTELPGTRASNYFVSAHFSPDGTRVLVARTDLRSPGGLAARWADPRSGRLLTPWRRVHEAETALLARSPDRRRLLAYGPEATSAAVLDAETLAVLDTVPHGGWAGALADDGTVALAPADGTVMLHRPDGATVQAAGRHAGGARALDFVAGAETLISAGDDGVILAWDVADGTLVETLRGHSGRVADVAITGDGRTLHSVGLDGNAITWDMAGDRRLARPLAARPTIVGTPPAIALAPDERLLVGEADGGIAAVDTLSGRRTGRLSEARPEPASALATSPDGALLAVATGAGPDAGEIDVLDARTGEPVRTLGGVRAGSQAVAFSPDGRTVVAGDYTGAVHAWSAATGERRWTYEGPQGVQMLTVAVSPDGRQVAAAAGPSGTHLLDAASGRQQARLPTTEEVRTVGWSPDGGRLLAGRFDGRTELWDVERRRPAAPPLGTHQGFVLWVGFAPRGGLIATAGTDGTVMLWDAARLRRVGTALPVVGNRWLSAAFSPDGRRLHALPETGDGVSWSVDREEWKRHACAVAGRDLTPTEWREAAPGLEYRRVCGR